jgi:hypothetical protein
MSVDLHFKSPQEFVADLYKDGNTPSEHFGISHADLQEIDRGITIEATDKDQPVAIVGGRGIKPYVLDEVWFKELGLTNRHDLKESDKHIIIDSHFDRILNDVLGVDDAVDSIVNPNKSRTVNRQLVKAKRKQQKQARKRQRGK